MHVTMSRTVFAAILTMLLLPAARTTAQQITSPYRFLETRQAASGYVGYLSAGAGSLDLGPRGAALLGGRYDLVLSGPFALEADISYFSSMRAVIDTVANDTTRIARGDADFTIAMAAAALRFNLTGARTYRRLLPYVVFGLGVAIDLSSESELESELPSDMRFDFGTSFAGTFGGGIEWLTGPGLGFRLDARNLLWKLQTPRPFLKGEQALRLPSDEWTQNWALSAGLVYHF